MHHNETVFPDSHRFKPERWLDPAERKRLEKYMVAFSKGSRQCIGIQYVCLATGHSATNSIYQPRQSRNPLVRDGSPPQNEPGTVRDHRGRRSHQTRHFHSLRPDG
jgi:hypothetical protein